MEQDLHTFLESLPNHIRVRLLDTYLKLGEANSQEEIQKIFDNCPHEVRAPVAKLMLLIKKEELLEQRKDILKDRDKPLREDALKILLALIPARPLEPVLSLADKSIEAAKRIHDQC
jgi:hypothetical protein